MNWAKTILKIREKGCMSQTEFAEKIGTTRISVTRWETGKFEPSYKAQKQIVELCEMYEVNLIEEKEPLMA